MTLFRVTVLLVSALILPSSLEAQAAGAPSPTIFECVETLFLPSYAMARGARIEGVVEVRINVQDEVTDSDLTVLRSDHTLLLGHALWAIRQWRYRPSCHGSEVAARFEFKLRGTPSRCDNEDYLIRPPKTFVITASPNIENVD